ncbi:ABC transporter ATP-binding protein [Heliorestis convoluta]|uniref:ABC transporter family protein, ATP binding domain n=1 Tax=Heliorestis convoluta TaxID=356322 RepID=A0A5Q2MXP8_9FIRM|nr:ATP-binding cassette domain-containing protein [Heliorestis convoluta]QGG47554.1 ABC transporter family protein, ATP binding domain [Heliorestis convoluta]
MSTPAPYRTISFSRSLLQWSQLSLTLPSEQKNENERRILQNLQGLVSGGEIVALLGPSGSGKSTLLKMFNRLLEPTTGTIFYQGQKIEEMAVTELRRQVAYISQQPYLFPGTVADNLAYGADLWNLSYDGEKWLEKVNLSPTLLLQSGENLSGGERQRLALARSLLLEPTLLLLDEPTAALDIHSTAIIEGLIKGWLHQDRAVLWVTHDPGQAKRVAHRILLLAEGTLQCDLSTEVFFSPQAPEVVQSFLTVKEK